jgi:hypothetical protein
MEYNKIVAVTGLPGLYELLASKTDGAIVRSLDDKSTRFVSSRIHNFSHLESIEIFTKRENVNLVEVLKAIDTNKEELPDGNDNAALKTYFSKVYPELDFDRVYSSDLKKMIKWFSVLKSNQIEFKLSEPPAEEEQKAAEETKEAEMIVEEPSTKPKNAAAKKAKKEDKKDTANVDAPKPKKSASKKKSEK